MSLEINQLDRIIYGKNPATEDGSEHLVAIAMSENLTPEDADLWRGLVTLELPTTTTGQESQTVGLFNGPDRHFILAQAHTQPGDPPDPVYQCVLLPRLFFLNQTNNIKAVIDMAQAAFPTELAASTPLASLTTELGEEETGLDRAAFFQSLLNQHDTLEMPVLFMLLDAALSDEHLLVRNFSTAFAERIALIQGLMFLLPTPARGAITFILQVNPDGSAHPRVAFDVEETTTSRQIIDLLQAAAPEEGTYEAPYVQCLANLWQEKTMDEFVAALAALATYAEDMALENGNLRSGLTTITEQHRLDLDVLSDVHVPVEELLTVLTTRPPAPGELQTRYVERLLTYTLQERDSESAILAAKYLDDDAVLYENMNDIFTQTLESEPDAVYFFVRTHLAQNLNLAWLPMLQQAATTSLQVAIQDGDSEILIEWLELIAREPDNYQLETVLHDGIQKAQQQAHEDGDLGQHLLLFVCRRIPALVETLLDDDLLSAQIDAPLGPALRDYEPAAISETFALSQEIMLISMTRAALDAAENEAAAKVFSPSNIDLLWALGPGGEPAPNLPEKFSPDLIIEALVTGGVNWLNHESLQILLSHIVSIEDVARLRQIGIPLMESDQLPSMLVIALQSSDLPAENIIQLLNDFNTDALLSAQQLVKIYLRLIEHHNWQRDLVHLLVEQVARQIQQHQEVTIAVDVLWQMLHIAGEGEIDIVDRVVTRRILTYVEAVEDDTRLVDMMIRLHGQQKKNSISNRVLLNWWREFAQQQPPPRLRNLNQLLQERRELEAVRAILTTSHAIKKAIGPHTLVEFAGGIDVAFTILQTLSDSFDPANRPELAFDRLTVQAELNAREDELDVDEQRVLAKNLRELAQLVAMMADFRSKPSMLRREEDIDRQLLNGEQAPHSAIDTMKWLSGYLNGTQNNGDGE